MTNAHRIYICCDVSFPHGQAAANYIRSLSFLLRDAGHQITVIGYSVEPDKKNLIGEGIAFRPYNDKNNKLAKLSSKLIGGRSCVRALKDSGLTKEDVVVYYASNDLFASPVMRYAHHIGCRVCTCVVEWHQRFQYPYGAIDPRWISNKRCFEKTNCKADLVLPISECIETFYQNKGCSTQRLLPLIDTQSVVPVLKRNRKDSVIRLFYTGNPGLKDDLQAMFDGVMLLDHQERKQVEFYLMGVSQEELEKDMPKLANTLSELGKAVTIPGWFEYGELMKLYDQLDYLFLARFDNQVTKANYPSKVPEVMARGIAVIGSQTGDYWRDLIDGYDSILFQKTSPESCRDAIRRALAFSEDEKTAIKKNARNTAENKYDYRKWLHVADAIIGTGDRS